MKNLSLILNIVLVLAVGVLFYLHFSDKKTAATDTTEVSATSDSGEVYIPPANLPAIGNSTGKIAYINLEEFIKNYEYYKVGIKNIERGVDSKRTQLMQKQKQLEDDFQKYQQAAPTLSETYRKSREEQLMQQEQELYQLKDQLEGKQADEMARFQESLMKKLDDYFKHLGKEQDYSYVFTYQKGLPATLVYAKDSLDITKQVVDALNTSYKKK